MLRVPPLALASALAGCVLSTVTRGAAQAPAAPSHEPEVEVLFSAERSIEYRLWIARCRPVSRGRVGGRWVRGGALRACRVDLVSSMSHHHAELAGWLVFEWEPADERWVASEAPSAWSWRRFVIERRDVGMITTEGESPSVEVRAHRHVPTPVSTGTGLDE